MLNRTTRAVLWIAFFTWALIAVRTFNPADDDGDDHGYVAVPGIVLPIEGRQTAI